MITSEFLESEDQVVEFEDASHIRRYFAAKDFRQRSRRKAGVKEDHGERHSLRCLLVSIGDRYTFPLTVTKRERPDFLLASPDMEVGLEVSQATTTEIEQDYAQMSDRGKGELVEYGPDGHKVIPRGASLEGPGFYGYQDYQLVAGIAARALKSKIEKLNKPGFYKAWSDQLLLLDTYGLTLHLDDPSEVKALQACLRLESSEVTEKARCSRHFDAVHFIYEPYLFLDITKRTRGDKDSSLRASSGGSLKWLCYSCRRCRPRMSRMSPGASDTSEDQRPNPPCELTAPTHSSRNRRLVRS